MVKEVERRQKKKIRRYPNVAIRYSWAVPASLLLLLLVSSGVVIGANKSMPDEPLYSIKTTMEKVRLKLTPSDLDKATLHIHFAERRAEEIIEMNKNTNTHEAEKLAKRAVKELDYVVISVENIIGEKDWEEKAERVSMKLLNSSVLNSGSVLSSDPIEIVQNSTEETIIKLSISEVSQARARIEFANQRVDKLIELSLNEDSKTLEELLQEIEQQLVSLEPLIVKLKTSGDREAEVREITTMLENAAAQNIDKFDEKLEKVIGDKRQYLEWAREKSVDCFDNQVESLHNIIRKTAIHTTPKRQI